MKMKILLLFYFVSAVRSISYTRTRFLENNPDTVLHYDVKNGLFIFKLEAAGKENFQIGLAFATKMVKIYKPKNYFVENAICRIHHRMVSLYQIPTLSPTAMQKRM